MDPDEVVVDVAEVDAVLGRDRVVVVAGQAVEDLALRGEDPVQPQGRALDPEDRLQVTSGTGCSKTSSWASSIASSRCSIAGRYSATTRSRRW